MRTLVRDLWAGDVPLAQAFWEFGVLYAVLLGAASTMGSLALWSLDQMVLGMIVHVLPTPYAILTLVAVWRSAGKYPGDAMWAGMARAAIAIIVPLSIIL
jgi:hypothetical protein